MSRPSVVMGAAGGRRNTQLLNVPATSNADSPEIGNDLQSPFCDPRSRIHGDRTTTAGNHVKSALALVDYWCRFSVRIVRGRLACWPSNERIAQRLRMVAHGTM